MIGSGIFMKPATMAAQLHSPWMLLIVWLVAGLITLCGALSNAEAACMFPETGGQYIYFEKMYGKLFSYLYGWSSFAVFNTAGNASIAYVCTQYLDYFIKFPTISADIVNQYQLHIPGIGNILVLENFGVKVSTIILLLFVTLINIRSTKSSAVVQNFLSALKVIAILLIVIGGLSNTSGDINHFKENVNSSFSILTFMSALTGAFWAYDGWNNIGFVGGEIKNPQTTIPKSLLGGILSVILIYVLVNFTFIYILGINSMSESLFVATDAATKIWSTSGAILVTLIIIFSTLGTVNSNVLSTARVTYALGKDHKLFHTASTIHPLYKTPSNALMINLVWSGLLILSGSFDMLTDMLIFITWFFYGMSALGVIILRFKIPDTERPYKVWMYPLPNLLFVGFSFTYLSITLFSDIQQYLNGEKQMVQSIFGLLICVMGLPFYWWGKRNQRINSISN